MFRVTFRFQQTNEIAVSHEREREQTNKSKHAEHSSGGYRPLRRVFRASNARAIPNYFSRPFHTIASFVAGYGEERLTHCCSINYTARKYTPHVPVQYIRVLYIGFGVFRGRGRKNRVNGACTGTLSRQVKVIL